MSIYQNVETDKGRSNIEQQFEQEFSSLSEGDNKICVRLIIYICTFIVFSVGVISWIAWKYTRGL